MKVRIQQHPLLMEMQNGAREKHALQHSEAASNAILTLGTLEEPTRTPVVTCLLEEFAATVQLLICHLLTPNHFP